MRTLKYLLPLLIAPFCFAQGNPNCTLNFTLNAVGSSANYANSTPACDKWTLTVYNIGFSGFSLTLQSAAAATTSTPSTFGTYGGTTATGSNPLTATGIATFTNGTVATPWLRVTLSGITGTGIVYGVLQGSQTVISKGGGSGGTGPAGGDLSGTYPNPTVVNLSSVTNGSLPNSGLVNDFVKVNLSTCTLGGSGCLITAPPSGGASGDLSGSYPNPTVSRVNGNTPGGSCPGSEFVNAIDTSARPTCATPSGGGGGGPTIAGTTNQIAVSGAGCTTPSTATCTVSLPNASVSIDPSTGNFSTPGSVTSGSGSGVAGIFDLAQGTAPSIPANSFGFVAPTVITTSEYLQPPNAVPAAHSSLIVDTPTSNVSPFHYKIVPDCQDSGGNHLNFTQSTDNYSCGTSGGGGGTPGSTLFSSTSSATATATSPTSLIGTVTGSTTIPINTFAAGQYFQIIAQGYYSTPATPASLTINLNIGGTTRISTGAVVQIASVTNGTWRLSCGFTTRTAGASGTQIANCIFEGTGATLTPGEAPLQTSSTWTIDTTATQVIDVTATWSTTTGAPTITGTNVVGFIPGAAASGGGGGSTRGAFASRPSCSTSGSTYFSTDVPILSECNGSTWADTLRGMNVTLPSLTSFSNRNTSTVTLNTNGWMTMILPAHSGTNIAGQEIAIPATPYTLTACFFLNAPYLNFVANGIYVTDGTKLVTMGTSNGATGAGSFIQTSNWNSVTSFNALFGAGSISWYQPSPICFQLVDDGTNFQFSTGVDTSGPFQNFGGTVSRTAFLTPTAIGWFGDIETSTIGGTVTLTSWQVH